MSVGGPLRAGNPWNRLAQIARNLTIAKLSIYHQKVGDAKPFPLAPTQEEYAEAFQKQIELELIWARIEENESKKRNESNRLVELHEQRRQLEFEISRDAKL